MQSPSSLTGVLSHRQTSLSQTLLLYLRNFIFCPYDSIFIDIYAIGVIDLHAFAMRVKAVDWFSTVTTGCKSLHPSWEPTEIMKKLFSKIETSSQQSGQIGKIFNLGRYTVTVEDVIAEGNDIHEFIIPSVLFWRIYLHPCGGRVLTFSDMSSVFMVQCKWYFVIFTIMNDFKRKWSI